MKLKSNKIEKKSNLKWKWYKQKCVVYKSTLSLLYTKKSYSIFMNKANISGWLGKLWPVNFVFNRQTVPQTAMHTNCCTWFSPGFWIKKHPVNGSSYTFVKICFYKTAQDCCSYTSQLLYEKTTNSNNTIMLVKIFAEKAEHFWAVYSYPYGERQTFYLSVFSPTCIAK